MSKAKELVDDSLVDAAVRDVVKDLVEDVTMFLEINDDVEPPETKRRRTDSSPPRGWVEKAPLVPLPDIEVKRAGANGTGKQDAPGVFFDMDSIKYVQAAPMVFMDHQAIPVEILDNDSPEAKLLHEQLTRHVEKVKAKLEEHELRSEEEETEAGPSVM